MPAIEEAAITRVLRFSVKPHTILRTASTRNRLHPWASAFPPRASLHSEHAHERFGSKAPSNRSATLAAPPPAADLISSLVAHFDQGVADGRFWDIAFRVSDR